MTKRLKRCANFQLTLDINSDTFIQTPRDAQRSWLINQFMSEAFDDLNHLHQVAKTFVPGCETEHFTDTTPDLMADELSADEIMESWQTPLMERMAEIVCKTHGHILEVGFGRGVSASYIQAQGVASHTIIEVNETLIETRYKPWRARFPENDIRIVQGKWQDVIDRLGQYDGIFFHTYPLNEEEFFQYIVYSITFAEHFFATAAKHLNPHGTFTYLSNEIDSIGRRHQRALLQYFKSIAIHVEPLAIPDNTKDLWWANSMVVIEAVK